MYEYSAECDDYTSAIDTRMAHYIEPKNEVFAKHILATWKQKEETIDEHVKHLQLLSKDFNFKASQNWGDFVRDDFISDLSSRTIRQYLLENKTLDLSTAVDHAMAFDVARLFTATVNAITGIGPSSFCRSHVCHYSSKKQVPFLWMR